MADQIDRLIFQVSGRDSGGSKVLSDASRHADAAHTSFSRLGSTLSGLDGPFGQVTTAAGTLGDALQGTTGFATKLGLGLTAAGVGLIAFAAKDQQAQRQLQQSIQNTGASYADYRGQIEEAIKAQERNAHTADDTQNALNTLTTATQDTSKSLSEMGLVADVAAAKHENLAAAATQVVQAQSGNTRAFKSFGIVLDGTGTKTDQINRALKELQDRLSGQASASVDTFAGRLKVAETRLEDNIAALGKYGPEITAAGVALTVYAGALQLKAARTIADTAATAAETRAETANAAARIRTAEAANIQAGAIQRATVAQAEGAGAGGVGMLGRLGKGALIGGLGYYGATTVGNAVGGTSGRYLGDIGGGAAIGAGIGSIVPGVGTAVGAGVGAVVGLGSALLHSPAPAGASTVAQTEAGYQKTQATLATLQAAAAHSTGMLHQAQEAAIKDAQAALKAGQANHEYATALINEASAAKTATVSIDGQVKALQASAGGAITLSQNEDDLQASMHNMAQAAHDGGSALRGHTLAAEANRQALRQSASKILDVIAAMRQQHVGADKVRAATVEMTTALEINATHIYGNKTAVDRLLRSLHLLPGQVKSSVSNLSGMFSTLEYNFNLLAASAFNIGQSFYNGFNPAAQAPGPQGQGADPGHAAYTGPGSVHDKNVKAAAQQAANDVAKYQGAIDTAAADAQKKALDKAKQQAQQQMQAFAALEKQTAQQIASAYQSTKQGLIDAASLGNRPDGTDILGATGPAASILASKRQFARQMIHFAHLIHRLEDARYNPTVIDEVEGLGTVAGIQAAQELLAGGRKERRAVNRAEARIERAAGRISSQITGQDYNAEILKTLQRLPDQFDRKFEHTLRKLHIITDTGAQDRKQGHRVRTH